MIPEHRRQYFAWWDWRIAAAMERIPLRRLCTYVLSVPLLFILVLIVALTVTQRAAQRTALLTQQSLLVIDVSDRLNNAVAAADSSLRGFALTGDPIFSRDFERATQSVPADLGRLERLVRDNPDQLAAAAHLRILGARYLTLTFKSLDLLRHNQETNALGVMGDLIRPLRNRFGYELNAFIERERRLQVQRELRQRHYWNVVNSLLAAGIAAFFFALLVSFFAAHYSIRRITRIRDKAAEVGHVPPAELALGNCNEIFALERAFSEMATAIKEREDYLSRYQLLSQQALDIIVSFRRSDGRILEANESALKTFGYSRAEFLNLTVKDVRPPEAAWEVDRVLARQEVGGRIFIFPGRRKNGSIFPLEVTLQATTIGGDQVILGIGRDITERKRAEEALERYRILSEHSSDIIVFIRRSDGRILEVNKAAEAVSGYTREELLSMNRVDMLFPQDAAKPPEMLEKTDTGPVRYEAVARRKDGTAVPIEATAQGVTIGDERVVIAIARDITERKHAEEIQGRYQLLTDGARDMILMIRASDGRILEANEAALKTYGYSRDEMLALRVQALHLPEDFGHIADILSKTDGVAFAAVTRRKDASLIPVEITAQSTTIGGERVLVGIARDVTERKRAEEALVRFRLLSEHASEIFIFARGSDLKIIDANDAAVSALGYTRDELLSLSKPDLHPPEVLATCARFWAHVAAEGSGTIETTYRRKDGSTFPADASVQSAIIGNERTLLGVIRDATERRRIEADLEYARDQALDAARLKAEFLANMSHEIRTPMNAVIGATDLLSGTPLTPEQRDYTEVLCRSAEALLSTINNVLDISKLEAGKVELDELDFALEPIVDDVIGLLSSQASNKNLVVTPFVSPSLPRVLHGDPARVRQILLNLIGNAVKFTDRGGVTVVAVPEEMNETTVTVRFSVSDTGIGVSTSARRRLFKPFAQADGSMSRRYGGTGLGLSISKYLVEMMGGKIGVESQERKGSIFWFTVPFERSAMSELPVKTAAGALAPSAASAESSGRGPAILLAEDDALNRRIALRQLERLGYMAQAVSSGREAVEAFKRRRYDLIFMDCQMPDIDGYEATRRIRRLEGPAGRRVPIIAMTANVFNEDREACRAAGMDDHVSKPVTIEMLRQVLAKWSALPFVSAQRQPASLPPLNLDAPAPADLSRLRQICGQDDAELRSLVSLALTSIREQLDGLQTAAHRRDFDSVAAAAHKLRGSCANIGAVEMARLSLDIENAAPAGISDELSDRYKELEARYSRVEAFLINGIVAGRPESS